MLVQKGHIIENYKLDEVIGKGGTAIVWSVSNVSNPNEQKAKALKIFNSELALHRKSLSEIHKQYYRQKTITHPNIVSPLEIFDNQGVPAILFDKAEMSLQQLLQKKRGEGGFNENQLVDILGDITSGLLHLHVQEDIAHNDVKTDNILVFKVGHDYSYKLCDLDTSISLRATIMLRLTTKNERNDIYFTPLYVAPEKKEAVDTNTNLGYDNKKADVFSLGATILELCTPLELPVEQLIKQKKLPQILNGIHVSMRMKDLLASMLENDPAKRLSMTEVNEIVNYRQNHGFWPELHEEPKSSFGKYGVYFSILFLVALAFGIFRMSEAEEKSLFANYESHTSFIKGFACVCNERCGVINLKGEEIQPLIYLNCENQSDYILLNQDTFQIKNETLLKLN